MNIIIKGLHMDLTPAIELYINKKAKSLEKFCDESSKLEVTVGKRSKHHKSGDVFEAEFRVRNKGNLSRVMTSGQDLYSAIDIARDELLDTLSSKKDKKDTLRKKGARVIKKMTHGEKLSSTEKTAVRTIKSKVSKASRSSKTKR